jgi:hypothetical protein
MNNDDFEENLRSTSLKPVPPEWRRQILHAAERERNRTMARNEQSVGIVWLVSWLWPSPVAWGGLAALWLIILGASLSPTSPGVASSELRAETKSPRPVSLAEQRALLSHLLEPALSESSPANSHRTPRRSERPLREVAA